MIWYDEAYEFKDQPKSIIIGIKGSFNDGRVRITVSMYGTGETAVIYFDKIVNYMTYQDDIDADDILDKYRNKIEAVKTVLGDNFIDFVKDYQVRLSHQEKKLYYFDFDLLHWFFVPAAKYVDPQSSEQLKDDAG